MDRIVQGDTRKPVGFRLKTRGVITNLTGEELWAHYTIGDGAIKRFPLSNTQPTTGIVRLEPAVGNWDAPGIATGRVYIVTGGRVGPSWVFSILVEKDNHL